MKKRRLTKKCYISWDKLGYYAVTIIDLSYLTQRKLEVGGGFMFGNACKN